MGRRADRRDRIRQTQLNTAKHRLDDLLDGLRGDDDSDVVTARRRIAEFRARLDEV